MYKFEVKSIVEKGVLCFGLPNGILSPVNLHNGEVKDIELTEQELKISIEQLLAYAKNYQAKISCKGFLSNKQKSLIEHISPDFARHLNLQNYENKEDNLKKTDEQELLLLNHIQLVKPISSGLFGSVWEAQDTQLNRNVAVKMLFPSAPSISNLLHHAQVLARINHKNIVSVYTIGKIKNKEGQIVDAIIMELLNGPTLRQRLQTVVNVEELILWGNGLIDGLSEMHNAGIVHRDLHEENVIIFKNNIKIIDLLYIPEKSLNVLSTLSKEACIEQDILFLKHLLTILLKSTSLELDFNAPSNFRERVQTINTLMDLKHLFIKIIEENKANKNEESSANIINPEVPDPFFTEGIFWRAIAKWVWKKDLYNRYSVNMNSVILLCPECFRNLKIFERKRNILNNYYLNCSGCGFESDPFYKCKEYEIVMAGTKSIYRKLLQELEQEILSRSRKYQQLLNDSNPS